MEKYMSAFCSIEIQIMENERRVGDRLKYFVEPFNTTLKRTSMNEYPREMEVAYDAAPEYGIVYVEPMKPMEGTDGKLLLKSAVAK